MALAASGGTAVVVAAGTDAWQTLRGALARWFARGDAGRERMELERLDRTAAVLREAAPGEVRRVSERQETAWQTRIEDLLEGLPADERSRAADELRSLVAGHVPGAVSAGDGGVAVGGEVRVHAEGGSIATVRMGDLTIGARPDPPQPGPDHQG